MQIKLNGKPHEIDPGLTIAALLEKLSIGTANLAIELNGDFLESEDLARREIRPGDSLEIVRFVGGG